MDMFVSMNRVKFHFLRKCFTLCAILCLILHILISTSPSLNTRSLTEVEKRLLFEKQLLASGVTIADDINYGAKNMSVMTGPLEVTSTRTMPIKYHSLSTSGNSVLRDSQMGRKSRFIVKPSQEKVNISPLGHQLGHNLGILNVLPSAKTTSLTSQTWQLNNGFIYNCSNINEIRLKHLLGNGITKEVFLGKHKDRLLAVKMVTENVIDVKLCQNNLHSDSQRLPTEAMRHQCFIAPNMKLMKEILLMTQLSHDGIQKLLGYCVRSEETKSTSLSNHGVIAVYEYGLRFYLSTLRELPLKERLSTAKHLTDLLIYLENSPLGSLRLSDFKEAHFLLTDGKIKLTDFDDVTSLEESCEIIPSNSGKSQYDHKVKDEVCKFGSKCSQGTCLHFNAKHNLYKMSDIFFSNLLFVNNSINRGAKMDKIGITLTRLMERLYSVNITALELLNSLNGILYSLS